MAERTNANDKLQWNNEQNGWSLSADHNKSHVILMKFIFYKIIIARRTVNHAPNHECNGL